MSKTEIVCKCGCGRKKLVRVADIKRGWGLYYSKSCKAIHQERTNPRQRADYDNDSFEHIFSEEALQGEMRT